MTPHHDADLFPPAYSEIATMGNDSTEADRSQGTTSIIPHENSELPPPPYSTIAFQDSNLIELARSQGARLQMEDFRRRAEHFQQLRDIEALRRLLLCMLKIEYGINARFNRDLLLRSPLAIQLDEHFRRHEDVLEAAGLFLARMPQAAKRLKVSDNLLRLMLSGFRDEIVRGEGGNLQQRCYRDHGLLTAYPIEIMAIKFWYHRTEIIDALVPSHIVRLRIELHAALLKKQSVYFTFLKTPDDYALTAIGKRIQKEWFRTHGDRMIATGLVAPRSRRAAQNDRRPSSLESFDLEANRPKPDRRCGPNFGLLVLILAWCLLILVMVFDLATPDF